MKRMSELIDIINEANDAYYLHDNPIMSDKQYDDLVAELEKIENETGVIMSNSPLHYVPGKILNGLDKVVHSKPMLSANKTKDMNEIGNFIGNKDVVQTWKLDGLTIVVRYENGKYKQAITRGNGEVGEDVTESIRHCINLPLVLSKNVDVEVRGECVISWENFSKINSELNEQYSHPRNLAAGSVRCLDTNVAKNRFLEFKAFELVEIDGKHMDVGYSLMYLKYLGFDVVEYQYVDIFSYIDIDFKHFNPETCKYPVDGTIYKYDSYEYGESLGATAHHPLNMIARKWKDELHETRLNYITWQTSKSGLINPVAVFEPVDLDGAITIKATLHNVSVVKELELGIGDTIQVYRANSVIPKVHDNLTRSGTCTIPTHCFCCGADTEIRSDNGRETLHCTNKNCGNQVISKFKHYCSRDAMNIDGMSEATIEKLIDNGLLPSKAEGCIAFTSLYYLEDYDKQRAMLAIDGLGTKSVKKMIEAIEASKKTTLDKFLYSLSIPNIGKTVSKAISQRFDGDWEKFHDECILKEFDFTSIDGIGETLCKFLQDYIREYCADMYNLALCLKFVKPVYKDTPIAGKTFVVTGKLNIFENRNELVEKIESLGGKVSGTVSKNTSYLVNNDVNSTSGKNKKAKELNIPIITEQILIDML